MAPPNMQLRGICPLCRRGVALLPPDNTVARPHKAADGLWCRGYGMEGEPYPPPPPERIAVRRSGHTGRWKVTVGGRLAFLVDDWETACLRAGQLADRERERVLLTAEQFPSSEELDRERHAT